MPSDGLDGSWVLAINHTVSQGFSFGSDIIFTYGPFSGIITKAYHPTTEQLVLIGATALGTTYYVNLSKILKVKVILLLFFLSYY